MSSETAQKKESLLLEKIDSLQCEVQALSLAKQVRRCADDGMASLTGREDRNHSTIFYSCIWIFGQLL